MRVIYDQHFLNDKKLLLFIAESAEIKNEDNILEVGPGKGPLTWQILEKKPKSLTSIELDEDFSEYLQTIKKRFKNFSFLLGNSLELIDTIEFNKLVANIPYSITEPLS